MHDINKDEVAFFIFQKILRTTRGIGSSDSSIRTTWPIFGLFSESGSTHLKAVRSARLRTLVEGRVSMVGSTTSSERLLATIIFNQSTRFTCKRHKIMCWVGKSQGMTPWFHWRDNARHYASHERYLWATYFYNSMWSIVFYPTSDQVMPSSDHNVDAQACTQRTRVCP